MQASGVLVILLTAGSGLPVGAVLIKAGWYLDMVGLVMEVVGYVWDERYTEGVVAAVSLLAVGAGMGADLVYRSLRQTTLSGLPGHLRAVVRAGSIDAPRLAVEQLVSQLKNQAIQSIDYSHQMCVLPSATGQYLDPVQQMCVMPGSGLSEPVDSQDRDVQEGNRERSGYGGEKQGLNDE